MVYSLAPKEFWQAAIMKHRTDLFHKRLIESFGGAIVFGSVVNGKPSYGTLFLEVC